MNRRTLVVLPSLIVFLCLAPRATCAQQTPATTPATAARVSRGWLLVGGAATTLLGDCTNCAADTYIRSGSVVASAGTSLNERTDLGGEVLWVPAELTTGDRLRVTFLTATVQFRPWRTKGFFLKAGSGMAFLRNWLKTIDEEATTPVRSKAFALALGAGWEWRAGGRIGLQASGMQHVAALGDLQTSEGTVENVVGNFWSAGAAMVVRW